MLIISQNKLKTTEKMELRIYPEYKDFEIIGYGIEDSLIELGVYKTEERAKEVLDEIIDTYKFNTCIAVGQKNAVYAMPEE